MSLDGSRHGSAAVPLAFEEPRPGWSEQNPELWWTALGAAVDQMVDALPTPGRIGAIAICGFTRTQVFLDAPGGVIRPAIGFRDSRAQEVVEAARAAGMETGGRPHPAAAELNPFHPLARLLWLRREEPEAWKAVATVLEPKDYLAFRLTGRQRSDRISQHWLLKAFAGDPGSRMSSLAESLELDRSPLPEVGTPTDEVGEAMADLPGGMSRLAGARVFCGSNDTWSAVAGLGALRAGCAYGISGSSEVFGLMADRAAAAEGLLTLEWGDGLWQIGGPGQNGANVVDWIVDKVAPGAAPAASRLEQVLSVPATGRPLIFHPFLQGERVPYWDRDLRAAFIGLSSEHGAADLVRAVMEESPSTTAPSWNGPRRLPAGRRRRCGWPAAAPATAPGTASDAMFWAVPLALSEAEELGQMGCLAVARVGLGLEGDIASAARAVGGRMATLRPDSARQARYDRLYDIYRETLAATAAASHRLALVDI